MEYRAIWRGEALLLTGPQARDWDEGQVLQIDFLSDSRGAGPQPFRIVNKEPRWAPAHPQRQPGGSSSPLFGYDYIVEPVT